MKNVFVKSACLAVALSFSGSAMALGQEGDSRVQANVSFTDSENFEDVTIVTAQYQRYMTDSLTLGGSVAIFEAGGFSQETYGITVKKSFPSDSDTVPYVGAAGLYLDSDFDLDDDFVYSVSAGADMYIEENFGVNFDATQGLVSDSYEDLVLSAGLFVEF